MKPAELRDLNVIGAFALALADDFDRAIELLETVGLADRAGHRPAARPALEVSECGRFAAGSLPGRV